MSNTGRSTRMACWLLLAAGCSGRGLTPAAGATAPKLRADAGPADAAVVLPASWHTCGTVTLGRAVDALAVSGDGRYLAGASAERPPPTIVVWRLSDLRLWRQIDVSVEAAGLSLSFSAEGALLAAAGDGRAVYTLPDGNEAYPLPPPGPDIVIPPYFASTSVRFSPDGKLLALGGWGQSAFLVDGASGQPIATFPSGMQSPGLAFSSDSRWLATSVPELVRIADGHKVWAAPAPTLDPDLARYVESTVEFSPEGDTLLVSICGGNGPRVCVPSTRLYAVADGKLVQDLGATLPRRPQFLPGGAKLLAGARILDRRTGDLLTLPVSATVSLYLPDGRIAAGGMDGTVRILCGD
jgi:WD40 repeat protein